jgi:hypothetical protein
MKCIAGIGKGNLKNSNWEYAYTNGFVAISLGKKSA